MNCGSCSYTDGCCYTSMPPQVKCTITGEFHYYDDECNCEYSRLLKEKEQSGESLIERFPESELRLNADSVVASEYEFPDIATEYICEPMCSLCTPCLICGETVVIDIYGSGPRVCDSCKEAIQFVKDKLMEKKDD